MKFMIMKKTMAGKKNGSVPAKNPIPRSIRVMPRYIGFRVSSNGP